MCWINPRFNEIQDVTVSASNYLLKINNRNTRERCDTCLKLTIKHQNDVNDAVLVYFFLTFYIFHTTDNHYTKALLETPSLSYVSVCACNEVILVSISEIAKKLATVYHPKTHLKFSGKCNAMNKNWIQEYAFWFILYQWNN